jgi:hypothetical protein
MGPAEGCTVAARAQAAHIGGGLRHRDLANIADERAHWSVLPRQFAEIEPVVHGGNRERDFRGVAAQLAHAACIRTAGMVADRRQ